MSSQAEHLVGTCCLTYALQKSKTDKRRDYFVHSVRGNNLHSTCIRDGRKQTADVSALW